MNAQSGTEMREHIHTVRAKYGEVRVVQTVDVGKHFGELRKKRREA